MTEYPYNRRSIVGAAVTLLAVPMAIRGVLAAQALPPVAAYRNPGCGCCEQWAERMRQAGFSLTMSDDPELAQRREKFGVPADIAGCHTASVGDYIVEGHVPPKDILRLLEEKPVARGLSVPGMPVGSPGMESAVAGESYDVLIFAADGSSKIFASY